MGLLGKIFSRKPDFPAIDAHSPAAARVAEVGPQLHELAREVSGPFEVVPSEHAAYVFIGKPPRNFGLAWIHDGRISGLNTLIKEHGLKQKEVDQVVDRLRDAYQRNADASRFSAKVENLDVVVTPSAGLEHEVHEIIDKIVRH